MTIITATPESVTIIDEDAVVIDEPLGDYIVFISEDVGNTLKLECISDWNEDLPEVSLFYSFDGENYTSLSIGSSINFDDKIFLRGKANSNTFYNSNGHFAITVTDNASVKGNILALLDWENPTTVSMGENAFRALFDNEVYNETSNTCKITDASKLKLPSNTLSRSCYQEMFKGCVELTSTPTLPATNLAQGCYWSMFDGCTSLTTAPALPATTLARECYWGMFSYCASLVVAPSLPATTLAKDCYLSMFSHCSSLTSAPALPVTTLAEGCYRGMFAECSSLSIAPVLPATSLVKDCYNSMFMGCALLENAPALPATTLAKNCYSNMFSECGALTTAPSLPATTLAENCYSNMFKGCTSLTSSPVLPANNLAKNCYEKMFYGCSNLNTITCLATSIPYESFEGDYVYYTSRWATGVSGTGTLYKNPEATCWNASTGLPSGWTLVDYTE